MLIVESKVRAALLDEARKTRAHKFTRVSKETLEAADRALRLWLQNHVARFPSKGKTL
jgi:hypothetical protein